MAKFLSIDVLTYAIKDLSKKIDMTFLKKSALFNVQKESYRLFDSSTDDANEKLTVVANDVTPTINQIKSDTVRYVTKDANVYAIGAEIIHIPEVLIPKYDNVIGLTNNELTVIKADTKDSRQHTYNSNILFVVDDSALVFYNRENDTFTECSTVSNINLWEITHDYVINDKVKNNERIYKCIVPHTSSTNFEDDVNNWIEVVNEYYIVTQAQYNKMVEDGLITDENNNLYIVKDSEDEPSVDDSQEVDDKYMLTIELTPGNPETIECTKTTQTIGLEKTIVVVSNQDSSDTSKIKAGDLVSITKEISGKVVYNYNILDSEEEEDTTPLWQENTDYSIGDLVLNNNRKYQAIKNHTSSSDFSTDAENWIRVIDRYYTLTQAQYGSMVADGLITDETEYLYIVVDSQSSGSVGGSAEDIAYKTEVDDTIENVKAALDKLMSDVYYVEPKINSFTSTPSTLVYEIGKSISSVVFNWSYNKNMVSQTLTDCTLADNTIRTATYNTAITSNKTFTLTASDSKKTITKTITFAFVNAIYSGVSATIPTTDSKITALNKIVETKGKKTVNYVADNEYAIFAYPSSYGSLSQITDQNGFNATSDFTKTTITINGVTYNVYTSNVALTTSGFKYNFVF